MNIQLDEYTTIISLFLFAVVDRYTKYTLIEK